MPPRRYSVNWYSGRLQMSDLPTVRDFAGTSGVHLVVWCKACRHQETVAFAKLAEAGKGDAPVAQLRFRCTVCRSRLTDYVVEGTHLGPKGKR
jgi:hypothetical protein